MPLHVSPVPYKAPPVTLNVPPVALQVSPAPLQVVNAPLRVLNMAFKQNLDVAGGKAALFEVLLMIIFGKVKGGRGFDLGGNGSVELAAGV